MEKIREILEQFTIQEMAYFVRYKLNTYMPSTQVYILQYIKNERKLTLDHLSAIMHNKKKNYVQGSSLVCRRCGSDKMFVYDVIWHIPLFKAGYEDEFASRYERATGNNYKKKKVECFVCGKIIVNPNNDGVYFWKRILSALKSW